MTPSLHWDSRHHIGHARPPRVPLSEASALTVVPGPAIRPLPASLASCPPLGPLQHSASLCSSKTKAGSLRTRRPLWQECTNLGLHGSSSSHSGLSPEDTSSGRPTWPPAKATLQPPVQIALSGRLPAGSGFQPHLSPIPSRQEVSSHLVSSTPGPWDRAGSNRRLLNG